ncbi:MAG: Na+/H+ antiporter NhaC family protein [Pseudomonadota bacterium]
MEQVIQVLKEYRAQKSLALSALFALLIAAGFWLISENHVEGTPWGAISLLPTIFVLCVAIYSRAPFESLLAGVFAGLIMLDHTNVIAPLSDTLSKVMGNEVIVWVILVCGLMGSLITLLEMSGCLNSFSSWLRGKIKSERQSLITTFIIGLVVFIDDYLNCLAVSSSVKKLTDFYKVSREKLAYVIDSTAAPMCVIVPVSTWAVFFAGLLEENGVAESGKGLSVYISAIPFMVYGWVALGLVFLVAAGIIGNIGLMKKAEARAKGGQPIPDDFVAHELEMESIPHKPVSTATGMFNFAFPMILLIASTVYYEIDLLKGVILTVVVTMAVYYIQGLLTFNQQVKGVFEGFKVMLYPLSTVVAGFMLKEINDSLGMTEYVINSITPFMSKEMLPALVFIVLASLVFGTASSWGVFIIAIPIVVPLAAGVDAHIPLVIGALLSASSFGSHACFFSDSTVLAAQGAGCSPMAHAFTQLPYAALGAVIAFIIFVFLGHAFA